MGWKILRTLFATIIWIGGFFLLSLLNGVDGVVRGMEAAVHDWWALMKHIWRPTDV